MQRQWKPPKKYWAAYGALCGKTVAEATQQKIVAPRPPKSPTEASEQIRLVAWADEHGLDIISIPNAGKRSRWQGAKEVAMGLTAGVSDLFLAEPRQYSGGEHYSGFWIEMKQRGKKPTALQYVWLAKMRRKGYRAEWFDDWEKARLSIEEYMGW